MSLFNICHLAVYQLPGPMNKSHMIAQLLYTFHTMGRKNNRCPLLTKVQDFLFNNVRIYRVKTTKGFIENEQFWPVKNRYHELDFLSHAFRKLLNLLVPP